MHFPLPARRARRWGAGPGNHVADPGGPIAVSVLGVYANGLPGCRTSGAGVIGTISPPSLRHEDVPEGRRNQIPSVWRSWALRAGPSVDDAGPSAGSR